MTKYFTVPGLGGSGEKHWQTWLEATQPDFQRIEQQNWNEPDIDLWVKDLDSQLENYDINEVILVAHSLGCLTVAEWTKRTNKKPKGALLVAPPDIEVVRKGLNPDMFQEKPLQKLDFSTVLIASMTDPWATIDTARNYADCWGSKFINIGDAGHINAISGHYEWYGVLPILHSI